MELKIFPDGDKASKYIAKEIADFISDKNSKKERSVLGLPTGNTPIQVYEELIRHHNEGLSFRNVITFNLDEYYPMVASRKESYHTYMNINLFNHIDIQKENVHIPDGSIPGDMIKSYCDEYEEKIKAFGGIDIQLLGIGRTGHIGFNEPGSKKDSKTRLVELDEKTRLDALSGFRDLNFVPKKAITMGIEIILQAKKIFLLSLGKKKAEVMNKCFFNDVSSERPASYLQEKENVEVVLDEGASMLIPSYKMH